MTQEQRDYMMNLLILVQESNDRVALDNLLVTIRDKEMKHRIGRYLYKNRQVENDDLKQEFMIGVAGAIPKADLEVGDPIEYIMAQGVYRVRSYLRKHIIQNTSQVCKCCGYESRLNRVGNHYVCKKCGSTDIETRELWDHDEVTIENKMSEDDEIEKLVENMGGEDIIEQFRQTLTPGTKVHALFVLFYDEDINSDNPDIVNYIKEIATRWNTSQTLVVQVREKLQNKLIKFCKDNGYEIVNSRFVVIDKKDGE